MNKPNSRLMHGCLLAMGCAGSLAATDAGAQSGSGTLEEIIVTAQRRELNLQNAAISASVLSGDTATSHQCSSPGVPAAIGQAARRRSAC